MNPISQLFGPQAANFNLAMDKTSKRFGLLSNNLANANVPGFKRKDSEFAISLDEAATKGVSGIKSLIGGQDGDIRIDGSSVDVEKEVVSVAETEARYQMLTEMTSRYFSGIKTVIREGR